MVVVTVFLPTIQTRRRKTNPPRRPPAQPSGRPGVATLPERCAPRRPPPATSHDRTRPPAASLHRRPCHPEWSGSDTREPGVSDRLAARDRSSRPNEHGQRSGCRRGSTRLDALDALDASDASVRLETAAVESMVGTAAPGAGIAVDVIPKRTREGSLVVERSAPVRDPSGVPVGMTRPVVPPLHPRARRSNRSPPPPPRPAARPAPPRACRRAPETFP